MHTVRPAEVILWLYVLITSMCLMACSGDTEDHLVSDLQSTLATRLADPGQCPRGDSEDVQQFANGANPGDSIQLPEGCFQIKTTVIIPDCTRLFGAGAGKTILYRDPAGSYSQPMLRVSGKSPSGCVTQISGLSLLGVRNTADTGQDYGIIITDVKNFRIDHSYLEGFGFAAIRVVGDSSGVIDHSIFVDNFKRGVDNLGYGVVVYGKGSWDDTLEPGSGLATFVEDSLFVGNRHAIAANAGAHYVFRNNQVIKNVEACAVDAHGMGYGSAHGTQYVEIYHNTIKDPVYDVCGIGIRGGGGVIFANTIEGYKNPVLLILEWGTPDKYKAEYPALDQVNGLYIWDNQIKSGHQQPQVESTGVGFIELGRDYFTEELTGYVPYPYPHPLAQGSPFDLKPWPPEISP